jgi:heme-degrading monooxygenase HmoA
MIARMWHGWTKPQDADTYETLLRSEMFPSMRGIQGFEGAYLLRRVSGEEVEFVTITLFASLDAVRQFAGEDYETAVLHPQAHALLAHYEPKSVHYEIRITPEQLRAESDK